MTALPFPEKIKIGSQPNIVDSSQAMEAGDNYVQVIETGLNPQHEMWFITYIALNGAELASVLSVLDSVRTIAPLTWTAPLYGVSKKYLIVKDSRKLLPLGAGLWELSLQLREVA